MREVDRVSDYLVVGLTEREEEEGREAEKEEIPLWQRVEVKGVPVIVRTATIKGVPVVIKVPGGRKTGNGRRTSS